MHVPRECLFVFAFNAFVAEHNESRDAHVREVWARLQQYPHCFELAAVRGTLDALNSDGSLPDKTVSAPVRPGRLSLSGFHVNVADVEDYLAGEELARELERHTL